MRHQKRLFHLKRQQARSIYRSLALLFSVVLLFVLVAEGSPAIGSEYRLGPRDKIRLKAYEWRATLGQVVEWDALNDEFTVGPDGMLSLPFAGDVMASGLQVGELAKLIAERFRREMGMGRAPDLSVEIVQFRPFYIAGDVDRPGEYPYRPGLTVLKALTIAGGVYRLNDSGSIRLRREAISSRGDLNVLKAQMASLLARKARFDAELNQSEAISFPSELTGRQREPFVALIIEQEKSIFVARREALATQIHALNQLKTYLDKEIVSLEGQLKTEDDQIRLVKKELQNISALVDKGLSVTPRQLSLERTLAQIEGDRLRVGTALLKARQEISKTDIAILELHNKRTNEATTELRATQHKLDEIRQKLNTAEQLLYEAEVVAPQSLAQRARARKMQPLFTILREDAGRTIEVNASETTPLEPGDTLKVEAPILLDTGPFSEAQQEIVTPRKPTLAPRSSLERTTGVEVQ
ncbi:MAG: polysaccharide biosynthesis/export family protein [Pseudorhodoplanes sp.]|jgi:polysaccharide export outer membrane protein/exopolysaccharide production protein ExoF|nr:polysaccharide biosynthesis/export family protein [Pseudorhodoplanes sp.]